MEVMARMRIDKFGGDEWVFTIRLPQLFLDSFAADYSDSVSIADETLSPFWGNITVDSRYRRIRKASKQEIYEAAEKVREELRAAEAYLRDVFRASFDMSLSIP